MEIDRLLWVSSVGLAINLFGMWATGGHHHHGHGHGHDHGHGHSHHIAVNEKKVGLSRLPCLYRTDLSGRSSSRRGLQTSSPPQGFSRRKSSVYRDKAKIASFRIAYTPLRLAKLESGRLR
jgi:zinc transporter 5/7